MCQYNNIYTSLHKYLKEKKKKHKPITIKIKNKKTLGIVATVPLGTVATAPLGIVATVQNMDQKKKKRRWVTKPNVQCKSTVRAFALSYIR